MAEPLHSRFSVIDEDEFFNQIQELRKKREQDLANAKALAEQIRQSESLIKAIAAERLFSAQKENYSKMEDAICTQFILGGIEGKADSHSIELVPGPFPRTILKVSIYTLALRVEENPAFPLFMIATDGNLNKEDLAFNHKLESHLKRLVKPYVWVPQSVIEDYLQWKRTK